MKISEEELVAELRRLHDELDDVPRQKDMNDHGEYSDEPYHSRFGSWNEALEAAGIEPKHHRDISDADLLAEIERLAEHFGRPPTANEMAEEGKYSLTTYKYRFDSWKAAKEKAGFGNSGQQFRTSQKVDYLREHGPSTMDELPGTPSLNVSDKMRGAASFAANVGGAGPDAGGRPTTVYYLIDEHDKEDVVRKFILANPKLVEAKSHRGISQIFSSQGKEWSTAASNVLDTFTQSEDRYADADFLFAVAQHAPARTPEVIEEVGCDRDWGYKRLKDLERKGDLECEKDGRVHVWTFPD
jgi:hypothetical protein